MNRYSPEAEQVLRLARAESDRLGHGYIGTDHLLAALIGHGSGIAAEVLQKLGLTLDAVRDHMEREAGIGPQKKKADSLPFTPRAKKVLALAGSDAIKMKRSLIGTEHILLGLTREEAGPHKGVLKSCGIDVDIIKAEVMAAIEKPTANDGEIDYGAVTYGGSSLTLLVDPGDAPPEVVADILACISIIYRMQGGSGIDFRSREIPAGVGALA